MRSMQLYVLRPLQMSFPIELESGVNKFDASDIPIID
jgi:hypothetical protein